MFWAICKTFHVLPNDKLFQSLEANQIMWIIQNLSLDVESQDRAVNHKPGVDTVQELETDTNEFENVIELMRQKKVENL